MPHVLADAAGTRFYSLSGWVGSRDIAMRFRTEADARDYAGRENLLGATAVPIPEQHAPVQAALPDAGRSIFGYGSKPFG